MNSARIISPPPHRAAALEPPRSLFHSYPSKAAREAGDAPLAEKEFRLTKRRERPDRVDLLRAAPLAFISAGITRGRRAATRCFCSSARRTISRSTTATRT